MKPIAICFHHGAELYGSDIVFFESVKILLQRFRCIVVLDEYGPLVTRFKSIGVQAQVRNVSSIRRSHMTALRAPIFLVRFVASLISGLFLMIRCRPTLVYVNTFAVLAPAFAGALLRLPVVTHCHEILDRPQFLGKILARLHAAAAIGVIAVSAAVAKWLRDAGVPDKKLHVIKNGFAFNFKGDVAEVTAKSLPSDFSISQGTAAVMCVGRLSEMKGQHVVIEAIACLPTEMRSRFVVVFFGDVVEGNESYRLMLESRIAELGIEDSIRFAGFREDAREYLSSCDFALVPSRFPDPLPTTVLEAMAAGRYVVGAKTGGIPEMIEDGVTGRLFEPGDAEGLARQIAFCLTQPDEVVVGGVRAKERFSIHFSSDRYRRDLLGLVEELVA